MSVSSVSVDGRARSGSVWWHHRWADSSNSTKEEKWYCSLLVGQMVWETCLGGNLGRHIYYYGFK